MKKIIVSVLVTIMCFSLTACGGNNIEKFCGGSSIYWDSYEGRYNDEIRYYALFDDGILTIEKRECKSYSGSPTGELWTVVDTQEYSYELKGNDTVVINEDTYTYEITNDRVKFNKALMGIDSYWKR